MPKYLIERDLPGAGTLTTDELQAISQKSCGVLRDLGGEVQWQESYVTAGLLRTDRSHSWAARRHHR